MEQVQGANMMIDYSRKFWAKRGAKQLGPFSSRKAAIIAMLDYPGSLAWKRKEVMTGYGNFGIHFDIQWIKPMDFDNTKEY